MDFLILGLRRSGTTSLWNFLRAHPQICPPKYNKELSKQFFIDKIPENDFLKKNYFPSATTKILIDATPGTFKNSNYIRKVNNFSDIKRIRCIFTLRNPISRIYSLIVYKMKLDCTGDENVDFISKKNEVDIEKLKNYFDKNFYTNKEIENLYKTLTYDNILFLKIEELSKSKNLIHKFLGINYYKTEIKKSNSLSQNPIKFKMIKPIEQVKEWFISNKKEIFDMMYKDREQVKNLCGVYFNEDHSLSFL